MNVITRKVCNALIKDAKSDFPSEYLTHKTDTGLLVKAMTYLSGGLWVGGNIVLYRDSLAFKPNKVNALLHKGDVSWALPLKKIEQVFVTPGFGTNIVNFKTSGGVLQIRCYRAKKFADDVTALLST